MRVLLGEYSLHFGPQDGQLLLDDIPNDLDVDSEVCVDQDVAQAGDPPPIDLGVSRTDLVGQVLDRFADDFQVADHGIEGPLVAGQRFAGESGRVATDLLDGLQDIVQLDPTVPGHGPLPRSPPFAVWA